ncbi:MAG: 30S ribosome-binding factor RbfA [Candidatus Aminicenantales bacterium]
MESRRQKRVGNLIKEELSRLLIEDIQSSFSGLMTITGVRMSGDLKTAYIDISLFRKENKEEIMDYLEKRKGHLRKAIASRVKLKYNPLLIFYLDRSQELEERIEKLLKKTKKDGK